MYPLLQLSRIISYAISSRRNQSVAGTGSCKPQTMFAGTATSIIFGYASFKSVITCQDDHHCLPLRNLLENIHLIRCIDAIKTALTFHYAFECFLHKDTILQSRTNLFLDTWKTKQNKIVLAILPHLLSSEDCIAFPLPQY